MTDGKSSFSKTLHGRFWTRTFDMKNLSRTHQVRWIENNILRGNFQRPTGSCFTKKLWRALSALRKPPNFEKFSWDLVNETVQGKRSEVDTLKRIYFMDKLNLVTSVSDLHRISPRMSPLRRIQVARLKEVMRRLTNFTWRTRKKIILNFLRS